MNYWPVVAAFTFWIGMYVGLLIERRLGRE